MTEAVKKDPRKFYPDDAYEFMRFVFSGRSLKVKKDLEEVIQVCRQSPFVSATVALKVAMESPTTDSNHFASGMLAGIALSMAADGVTDQAGLRGFLNYYDSKKHNVTDIAEALKARV